MHHLTLTEGERRAFDWVGNRYHTGQVAELLADCITDDDAAWSDKGDLTFDIPEHTAWQIADLYRTNGEEWPCFGYELSTKLTQLCMAVV